LHFHIQYQSTQYYRHPPQDDDNIELIDIECGNEGKPLLIVTDDNKTKAWETVAILEKTAGKGNFHYIIGEDEFLGEEDSDDEDFDDEDFDDEDFDDEDYISDPHEKLVVILEDLEDLVYDDETQFENDKKDLKLSLESTVENLEDLEDFGILSRVYEISERIFVNEFGFDAIEKETRKFFNIFNVDIQQIPYSKETLFGSKAELISSDYIDEVNDSLVVFGEELDTKEAETDEKAADIIRAFCKKYNDVPFVQFIEVEYLNDYSATSAKKTRKKLDEYIKNSPAYIPLQLLDAQFRVGNKEDVPIIRQILEDKNLESLYSTGNITQSELFTICYCLIHHVINEKNVVMMHAIYYAMSSVFGYKEITHKYLAILMTHHFQYYIEKYGKSRL
ncbi:MAG: hypothetical protein U9R19_11050, partial [Bacteroidota bacterium]|nr:hypothetical protein [Bacteroidota bacterium]